MSEEIIRVAQRARAAALELAVLSTDVKNRALTSVREAMVRHQERILAANRADKEDSARLVEKGEMTNALFKRLDLEGKKFASALAGIDDVVKLADPVGRIDLAVRLDDGLELRRISCPIGVLGIIFEARPEAAVQISSLALKSSNAVILKGGREADRSNHAIVEAFREGISTVPGVPEDAVQLISTREEVRELLDMDQWIDLVIPRGSNELVRSIQESTRIPVLGHADGICMIYIDSDADRDKAVSVVVDSKVDYPAACNAVETLLVHRAAAPRILPQLGQELASREVELRADAAAREFLPMARQASDQDFSYEFLDLILAVKVVDSMEEAVQHINTHGSHHTDAIITEDATAAASFAVKVDSAGVYHNASTRFADGFRYGLGAEVGVSTNKTHARGPVGLDGLVIYKYLLAGGGHRAGDYGPGKREFDHSRLPTD